MAAVSAKYFFNAHVKFQGNDIPILAFTPGDEYERGWQSNTVNGFQSLKETVWKADGARGLTIAIPRPFINYFVPMASKYDRLTIWASDGSWGKYGSYNHTMTFDDVVAVSVLPIPQGKGLPAKAEIFKNHWEKKIGRELYAAYAVILASGDTTVI